MDCRATITLSLPIRLRSSACAPMRLATPNRRNLTAFFGWSAWALPRCGPAPVFLHEQLASGTSGGQSCNSRHDCVERTFLIAFLAELVCCWPRLDVGIFSVGMDENSRDVVPSPGRGNADSSSKGVRLVLLCDGCAVPGSDAAWRRFRALPRRSAELLRN